ncbi:hypothetical protein [Microbacterium sp.]|uniref:hypothetical protein n=1 Tax=Microbacterium sp. TaxID=51671 RepID=UPI00356357EE
MSWLHHVYPAFAAVAVNSGWKARDAQLTMVSPENPTGYYQDRDSTDERIAK